MSRPGFTGPAVGAVSSDPQYTDPAGIALKSYVVHTKTPVMILRIINPPAQIVRRRMRQVAYDQRVRPFLSPVVLTEIRCRTYD